MSYDVNVCCSRCGHDLMEGRENMTSNLSAMWTKAGAPLRDWDGKTGVSILPQLIGAIHNLKEWPEDYRDLEPSNGWGDLPGCVAYLERIRDAVCREPFAKVRVSH